MQTCVVQMGNTTLFLSSLFFGYIHVRILQEYTLHSEDASELYNILILTGVATSIINHGTSWRIAKISDRIVMAIGFVTDVSLSYSSYTLWMAVFMYYLSKRYNTASLHVLAHYFLTLHHFLFLSGASLVPQTIKL